MTEEPEDKIMPADSAEVFVRRDTPNVHVDLIGADDRLVAYIDFTPEEAIKFATNILDLARAKAGLDSIGKTKGNA